MCSELKGWGSTSSSGLQRLASMSDCRREPRALNPCWPSNLRGVGRKDTHHQHVPIAASGGSPHSMLYLWTPFFETVFYLEPNSELGVPWQMP